MLGSTKLTLVVSNCLPFFLLHGIGCFTGLFYPFVCCYTWLFYSVILLPVVSCCLAWAWLFCPVACCVLLPGMGCFTWLFYPVACFILLPRLFYRIVLCQIHQQWGSCGLLCYQWISVVIRPQQWGCSVINWPQ